MIRTETDLRQALHGLAQHADQLGAPSTASLLSVTTEDRLGRRRISRPRHLTGWLPPLAAAAVVAAAAVTAVTLSTQHSGSPQPGAHHPGGPSATSPTATHATAPRRSAAHSTATPSPMQTTPTPATLSAAAILGDAAAKLDAAPWTAPARQDFYYVRTTQATTWTSVSGRRPGHARTAKYSNIPVPGCRHGQIVAFGEAGTCTLNDVPHYRADAPTAPPAWDAYLEHIAPGAKAANAQGKIIVEVLHQDLVAPKAAAALLRYTAGCPGLHTLDVRPVTGEKLIGVTCTSMANGSYGLAFDAASHAFVGFVGVTSDGEQDGAAEIIRQTGIVPAVGRVP